MKDEIKEILNQTFAYNVENDRVAQEILNLFEKKPIQKKEGICECGAELLTDIIGIQYCGNIYCDKP